MQLLYLWISEYRNFKNKGLNFNSQYEFDLDLVNKKLTYKKNENFIENFFGNQIQEITGIVGKNGVGKSNILELVNYSIKNPNEVGLESFFLIFKTDENNFVRYDYNFLLNIENKTSLDIQIQIHPGKIKGITNVFFSNIFDTRRYLFSDDVQDLSTNRSSLTSFGRNIYNFQQDEIKNQVKFISSPYFKSIKNNDLPMPEHLIFSTNLATNISHKIRRAADNYNLPELNEFYNKYQKRYKDSSSNKTFFLIVSFYCLIYFLIDPNEDDYEEKRFSSQRIDPVQISKIKFFIDEILVANFDIIELHHFILTTFLDFLENNFPNKNKLVKFLKNSFNSDFYNALEVKPITKGRYSKQRQEFLLPFRNKKCQNFVKEYLDVFRNNNAFQLEWSGISTGQLAFYNLFSRFHSIIKNVKQRNVLITIDEGDLYFHPNWQLNFLDFLIKGLSEIFGDRKLQIILTTHSPFLVSDLPKNNLIFIDRKDEDLLIVKPENIEIETFAANIYALYSKAFFLENGTISEFAYKKLSQLKKDIQSNVNKEDTLKLINQIGDTVIKKQYDLYLKKHSNETDK